jgi:AcrR family transcriptional regulator
MGGLPFIIRVVHTVHDDFWDQSRLVQQCCMSLLHLRYAVVNVALMPREVNINERLAAIGAATLGVAREHGPRSVTIRSVAAAMGGSTTLVTNYLPTRSALVLNALNYGRKRWLSELERDVGAAPATERLEAAIAWAVSEDTDDPTIRLLILEVLANPQEDPALNAWLERESHEFYATVLNAAMASGAEEHGSIADAAYLMVRGAYVAAMESPDDWTQERIYAVITRALGIAPRERPLG